MESRADDLVNGTACDITTSDHRCVQVRTTTGLVSNLPLGLQSPEDREDGCVRKSVVECGLDLGDATGSEIPEYGHDIEFAASEGLRCEGHLYRRPAG